MRIANLSASPDFFRWHFIDMDPITWIRNRNRVFKTDTCGEDITYWVTVTEEKKTYYELTHSYYWDEDEEGSFIANDFSITEISKETIDNDAKRNLRFVV